MITILSGGTGTPKLLQGIKEVVNTSELNIIVNTLENDYFSGVYVSADIDTVLYTMSNLINDKLWYGRSDDTFYTHDTLEKLGFHETLRIGDKDRALKIQKTELMKKYTLQKAVEIQKNELGINANILPMSNNESQVSIKTREGLMNFHDFLITNQSSPEVEDIIYSEVEPAEGVIESIEESDHVIIGPSNPITSINPIISMPGVKKALKKTYVTSVSPFIGDDAVSGPASKFMKAKGYDSNCVGVCLVYKDFLNHYIINNTDNKYKNNIEKMVPEVSVENIILKTMEDKINLAKKILQIE
ncbi:2-phospho-L-lactate transferase [Methanosphaera sp. WGK6]|uniref:2-phospho-L-lactate transferase n=1 Tax=Methanosphaera sp. WGK6 TaxID=1561964 RepID=UPI00084C7D59|nr:2-phospho-L-lactate transferase [Methanosphaera sp. WGK6]OED29947.1 LPPG:FO 2-phospho-L-lactate transferase [Methanosphaera sp. WGK6]